MALFINITWMIYLEGGCSFISWNLCIVLLEMIRRNKLENSVLNLGVEHGQILINLKIKHISEENNRKTIVMQQASRVSCMFYYESEEKEKI